MKKKIAMALGLISLVISGLTLFSAISRAEPGPSQYFIIKQGQRVGPAVAVEQVGRQYRSLELTTSFSVGNEVVKRVFILFSAEVVAIASQKLVSSQNSVLQFNWVEETISQKGNAYIDNRGSLHIGSQYVTVKIGDRLEPLQLAALNYYEAQRNIQNPSQFSHWLQSYFYSIRGFVANLTGISNTETSPSK